MKTYLNFFLLIPLISIWYCCDPDSDTLITGHKLENPKSVVIDSSLTDNPEQPTNFHNYWKMVIKTVDEFKGKEGDRVYVNILLGLPIPSNIDTSDTTFFYLNEENNKVRLVLGQVGWTIWDAHGFYPIIWDFHYKIKKDQFELEGFANIPLTDCSYAHNVQIINRFYFIGHLDKSISKTNSYIGIYKWEEYSESGSCISIEGQAEVSQE